MAAERAAPSGSRAAGMLCGLWVLVLVSSVLALEGKGEGRRENLPTPTCQGRASTDGKWERFRRGRKG